jgi:serine/threonine-protein kinase
MLVAHVYVEPAPLPPVSGLPPQVAEIYQACVAKDPADRPPAGEVAVALARAAGIQLRPHDDEPPAAAPVPSAPAPEGRRSRVSIVATIGLVVAALVATAFAFSGSVGDTGPVTTAPSGSVDASAEGLGQVGRTDVPRSTGPGSVGPGTTGPAGPSGPGDAPAVTPSREPGGGGPGVSPTAGPPPTSAPVTRTLTSDGGSVVATCQGTKAELLSIDPAPGYVINSANSGPATQVGVVFKGPTAAVRLNVMCANGEPRVIN